MDQQAKHRLTGGVILVVLLVLLVPEMLTGPRPAPAPPPLAPDQAPLRSYTMDLGESAHAHEPVAPSTAAPPVHEPVSAASAPASAPPPVSAPSVAASTDEPPPPPARAAAHPAPRHLQPGAAAQAASEHAPAGHTTPEHAAGGWTVQVGTFLARENAVHLVATLKSHGFTAGIVEASSNGHKLYRVRVGNERERSGAQKLLLRLKAAGQKGAEVVRR